MIILLAPAAAQTYTPPRTLDGKPDLQGIWQADNTASFDVQDHGAALGIPGGHGFVDGGELPYRPEALAQRKKNFENRATVDPNSRCFLPGVPRANYMPFPFQIFQTPNFIAILYEYVHAYRLIRLDGSKHPDDVDFWMGDSRGAWKGDTLVVDVANNNGMTWFDAAGDFHSDALHVVEHYIRTGPDTLRYEATIDDPKVFTRPWRMNMTFYRRDDKDMQLMEYDCNAYGAPGKK